MIDEHPAQFGPSCHEMGALFTLALILLDPMQKLIAKITNSEGGGGLSIHKFVMVG